MRRHAATPEHKPKAVCRNAALLAGLLAMVPPLSQAGAWRMDPERSHLGFVAHAQGEAIEGRFRRFEPQIVFDPAALAGARLDVRIDLSSVDTASSERDEALRDEDFFAIRRFPEARYLAESFRALGGDRYAADGVLDLHGVKKPLTLNFRWIAGAAPAAGGAAPKGAVLEGEAILEGESDLDRLDFGVGGGDWADPETIAREVKVTTRLVLTPAEP